MYICWWLCIIIWWWLHTIILYADCVQGLGLVELGVSMYMVRLIVCRGSGWLSWVLVYIWSGRLCAGARAG